MIIKFEDTPSPSKLIATMDKHRFGATIFAILFVVAGAVAVVAITFGLQKP